MNTNPQKGVGLLLAAFLFSLMHGPLWGQSVNYTSLNTQATLANKTINTNLAVGVTPGQESTSQSGALSYTVPISVPPGSKGMSPKISLAYSSLSKGGMLGQGWNLMGLSTITRGSQSFFFDGKKKPVDLSYGDRFFIDGVRLVWRSGPYGGNNATYRAEAENFSTITSHGSMGGSPQWFEVESKDGIVMEYGRTADSRFLNAAGNEVLFWRVNKIIDKSGNYIEFKYTNLNNDHRIDEILYTGNDIAGTAPFNRLKFHYKVRRDRTTTYEANTPVVSWYLLDKIVITTESAQAYKTYAFTYSFDDINSFLNKLVEKGSNGSSLNETVFKYGDVPNALSTNSFSISTNASEDLFTGDFDGDGYSDLLAATYAYDDGVKYNTAMRLYKRTATNANYNLSYYTNLPPEFKVVNGFNRPNTYSFMASDYTGNGRDDIITLKVQVDGSQNWQKLQQIRFYESIESPTVDFVEHTYATPPGFDIISDEWNYFYPGDFDGDGASDYILLLSNGNDYKAFVSYPSKGIFNQEIVGMGNATTWSSADAIYVLDFDGDGKQELMRIKDASTVIHTFTLNNGVLHSNEIYGAGFPTKWHRIYLGDFNGDRKTDLLVRLSQTDNNAAWHKAISTGDTFLETPFSFIQRPTISGQYSDDKLAIADFNGDGRMDIMHGWNNGSTNATLGMYYSRGDAFHYQTHTYNDWLGFVPIVASDLNGDGRADLVNRGSFTDPFKGIYFRKEGQELLLESVVDGMLNRMDFQYRRMNQTSGGFYSKGTTNGPPLINVQLPMHLIYRVSKSNGIGGFMTQEFKYEKARYHKEGKGIIGFEKVTSIDYTNDVRTVVEKEISTDYYVLLPKKTKKYVHSSNFLFNEVTLTNEMVSKPSNGYWHRVTNSREDKYLEGQFVNIDYTYDNYGNITIEDTNINDVERTTINSTFGQYGSPIPSLPTSVTTVRQRNGQLAHSQTTTLSYNNKRQMTQQILFDGQSKSLTTDYTYDKYGNPETKRLSANGVVDRNTTNEYDNKGRFRVLTTDALGQTRTVSYDPRWGKPLSLTKANGLTTSYQYDAFGRQIQTTPPEGYQITQVYDWDQNSSYGSTYSHKIIHPGKPDVKTYFDQLKRRKRVETQAFQNETIIESWTHDARGRLKTFREPYKSGESTFTTTLQYDTYNRVLSESNPFGTHSYAYTYNNGELTTQSTDPAGEVSSTVSDAAGRTLTATDNGGTLTYTYNSQGLMTQSKLNGAVMTTSTYDVYGLETQLIDKNAGTFAYDYNPYGEMIQQTNANNQTYNMYYDRLGRMSLRIGPGEYRIFSYYGPGSSATNRLRSVTNSYASESEWYYYDPNGRLNHKRKQIDGVDFHTYFIKNDYGDVTTQTFPSGVTVNYDYDSNGYLNKIEYPMTLGKTTLFTSQAMNGRRQFTQYKLGNNPSSTITYDSGIPTRYYTPGIQDLNLDWDFQSGNLEERDDQIKGRQEIFTYDNLNRLETSQVNGQPLNSQGYTSNGNIDFKSYVGTYAYDNSRNNAVVNVSNPNNVIPSVDQDIVYNSFDQPSLITEGSYELSYSYGHDRQRTKSVLQQNGVTEVTRYYLGDYEEQIQNGVQQQLHYIDPGLGYAIVIERTNGRDQFHYLYKDHLGSFLTATDHSGNVQAEQNFDAWGRRRNISDWSYDNIGSVPDWLYRGYTGHEELPEFGLINMNGRLYDPVVGRMLSADNNVQMGDFSQNYNRYSYAFNNPLRYTDPNGESIVAAIVIGAAIGAATHTATYFLFRNAYPNGWNWGSFFASMVAGGAGSGVSAALAQAGIGGFFGGFITGVATGTAQGVTDGLINKNLSADRVATSALVSGLMSGINQGIQASMDGRSFADGSIVREEVVADNVVVEVRQEGSNDCGPACVAAVDQSLGGDLTAEEVRAWFPNTTPDDPLLAQELWLEYAERTGNAINVVPDVTLGAVESALANNLQVSVILSSVSVENDIAHAVVVVNIIEKEITKVNGKTIDRTLYTIMDPARGLRRISSRKLLNAKAIVLINGR